MTELHTHPILLGLSLVVTIICRLFQGHYLVPSSLWHLEEDKQDPGVLGSQTFITSVLHDVSVREPNDQACP